MVNQERWNGWKSWRWLAVGWAILFLSGWIHESRSWSQYADQILAAFALAPAAGLHSWLSAAGRFAVTLLMALAALAVAWCAGGPGALFLRRSNPAIRFALGLGTLSFIAAGIGFAGILFGRLIAAMIVAIAVMGSATGWPA